MIDKALSFIANFINTQMKLSFGLPDDKVIASSLINPDGSVTDNIENKVIISLINIEHETYANYPSNYMQTGTGQYGKTEPPVFLNLSLLVSANYTSNNYLEALKMLSATIATLQAYPSFDSTRNPDLDPSVERMTFEIQNIPINELSHIWSGIGAKYVPSIIYKVRMIAIQKDLVESAVSGINTLQSSTKATR